MKATFLFVFLLGTGPFLFSQNLEQKIANEVCNCIGDKADVEDVEVKQQKCLSTALLLLLEEGNQEEKKLLATVGGVQKTLIEVKDLLSKSCPIIQRQELNIKKHSFYVPSPSAKANKFYFAGKELLLKGEGLKAQRKFSKAIKADEKFVLAIDQLALSYLKEKEPEQAIFYFKKSLSIYPEGEVALLNTAEVFSRADKLHQSMHYYELFATYYPFSPEGHFGTAKVAFLGGYYDVALENGLIALKIYKAKGEAGMVRESQQLIHDLYDKFNEVDRSDAFFIKTAAYGLELSLNNQ